MLFSLFRIWIGSVWCSQFGLEGWIIPTVVGCEVWGVRVVVMVVWRDESPLVNMFRNSPDGNSVVLWWWNPINRVINTTDRHNLKTMKCVTFFHSSFTLSCRQAALWRRYLTPFGAKNKLGFLRRVSSSPFGKPRLTISLPCCSGWCVRVLFVQVEIHNSEKCMTLIHVWIQVLQ